MSTTKEQRSEFNSTVDELRKMYLGGQGTVIKFFWQLGTFSLKLADNGEAGKFGELSAKDASDRMKLRGLSESSIRRAGRFRELFEKKLLQGFVDNEWTIRALGAITQLGDGKSRNALIRRVNSGEVKMKNVVETVARINAQQRAAGEKKETRGAPSPNRPLRSVASMSQQLVGEKLPELRVSMQAFRDDKEGELREKLDPDMRIAFRDLKQLHEQTGRYVEAFKKLGVRAASKDETTKPVVSARAVKASKKKAAKKKKVTKKKKVAKKKFAKKKTAKKKAKKKAKK
jgi:hypothetical protein